MFSFLPGLKTYIVIGAAIFNTLYQAYTGDSTASMWANFMNMWDTVNLNELLTEMSIATLRAGVAKAEKRGGF